MNDERQHSGIGLFLFVVYLLFYSGFVLLAAFAPAAMEWMPFAGVNLAVWYGLALIVVAFALALVYGWLRRSGVERPGRVSSANGDRL